MSFLFYSAYLRQVERYTIISSLLMMFLSTSLQAAPLTMAAAWDIAQQNNPDLKRTIANRSAIAGEIKDASAVLYNNPTINFEGRRRSIYDAGRSNPKRTEWGIGVDQTLELAGQQGFRRRVAENNRASLELDISESLRTVRAQLEEQFITVLAFQKRIETERKTLTLIEQNTALSRKRVRAGEDSKLDGNLAIVDAERARNQLALLEEQLVQARANLAATLQLPPQELPEVTGNLSRYDTSYTLDELLAAFESRPANKALVYREQSAKSRLDLEKSLRYPDLTVSLINSREAGVVGDDNITTLGFSVPVPIFRSNAAGIGRATTQLAQVEVDRTAFSRDAKTEIQSAWQRRQNLHERVERLNREVYPKLEENLRLSVLAFQSGEVGLTQLLIVQRQALDAQRDILEAERDLCLTQIELEYIAGWPLTFQSVQQ